MNSRERRAQPVRFDGDVTFQGLGDHIHDRAKVEAQRRAFAVGQELAVKAGEVVRELEGKK